MRRGQRDPAPFVPHRGSGTAALRGATRQGAAVVAGVSVRAYLPGGAEIHQVGPVVSLVYPHGEAAFVATIGDDEAIVSTGAEGCRLRLSTRDLAGKPRTRRCTLLRR